MRWGRGCKIVDKEQFKRVAKYTHKNQNQNKTKKSRQANCMYEIIQFQKTF